MVKSFERIVVVTSQHGEKYLGWIPDGEEPREYMENPSILLKNARLVAVQQQPRIDPATQQIMGMAVLVALLQIDMFPGPVPNLRLHPSAWYFPFENPETKQKIAQLVDKAEENEKVNQAVSAGLHVPGRG